MNYTTLNNTSDFIQYATFLASGITSIFRVLQAFFLHLFLFIRSNAPLNSHHISSTAGASLHAKWPECAE